MSDFGLVPSFVLTSGDGDVSEDLRGCVILLSGLPPFVFMLFERMFVRLMG